jgi:hypothetical protein
VISQLEDPLSLRVLPQRCRLKWQFFFFEKEYKFFRGPGVPPL